MAQSNVKIGTETSFRNNQKKVMLDANDLLVLFMCDSNDTNEEVTKYRLNLASQIAKIIKNPIEL